ncbi:MAG: hypothetical protein N2V72_00050 [Methanophagales archaeon]|nr:hypothetical protein [Methanophagales archaeon]
MVKKTIVTFYLNKKEMKTAETVVKTLKTMGAISEEASMGQVAKHIFLAFIDDMLSAKEKKKEARE